MVERIDREEGVLRSRDELKRADEEMTAAVNVGDLPQAA